MSATPDFNLHCKRCGGELQDIPDAELQATWRDAVASGSLALVGLVLREYQRRARQPGSDLEGASGRAGLSSRGSRFRALTRRRRCLKSSRGIRS